MKLHELKVFNRDAMIKRLKNSKTADEKIKNARELIRHRWDGYLPQGILNTFITVPKR